MKAAWITILTVFTIMVFTINISQVKATEEYETLDLTVEGVDKDYKVYMLLPKEYIQYAITQSGLNIEYTGAETLAKEEIPGIEVDKTKVQANLYTDKGIEYVQVLLSVTQQNHYQFKILKSYGKLDMKFNFQINGEDESIIMHLDNFRSNQDGTYHIKYNYEKDTLKNEVIGKGRIAWWQIVCIILIMLFIVFITRRRE